MMLKENHIIRVRPPAVADLFYPGAAQELAREVADLMAGVQQAPATHPVPKAIVAPHAGYIYSGPVAASVYAQLVPARAQIRRVVLLGPTHRVAVRGLALPAATGFATPLGVVEIDLPAVAMLRGMPQVTESAAAHALEHSLEVQLPFLQAVLEQFTLLPLAVGDASPEEVAQVLDKLWGGPETLIVVSSDLSHYLAYREAQEADRATAEAVLRLSTGIGHDQACGATPLTGLMLAARQREMKPKLIDLRNSGDTAGDRQRVVGYGAFAFYEDANHAH
jgi:AmmeMemoRadiSam system protein B